MLLSVLPLRLLVNNKWLYTLPKKGELVLQLPEPVQRYSFSNGFHTTPTYAPPAAVSERMVIIVDAVVKNDELIAYLAISMLLFTMAFTSGWWLLLGLAMVPLLLIPVQFYLFRNRFIKVGMLGGR